MGNSRILASKKYFEMPVNVPHDFGQFLGRTREPLLFVGSGLSYGFVPLIDQLVPERKDHIEAIFGTGSQSTAEGPYRWARAILDHLTASGIARPRLRLAEELGLLSDPRWTATTGLPLRRALPRHRVIARFAREELWDSICSLNWDTYIEQALLRIGFTRNRSRYPQPWLAVFRTIVTRDDRQSFGERHCFSILKPHGCVEALKEAREAELNGEYARATGLAARFKITDVDLERPWHGDPDDDWFLTQLSALLGRRPLMVLGWSISEPYLQGVVNDSLKRPETAR